MHFNSSSHARYRSWLVLQSQHQCGIAQGLGLKSAVEGIARNPEASIKVTVPFIGLAMIESLCIYALVVALILIYAHPQAAAIAKLLAK